MVTAIARGFRIRKAYPDEFAAVGLMVVDVYARLAGMPAVDEQPEYYDRLRDVGMRAANPAIGVFVAASNTGEILACVDFIEDLQHYAAGGTAGSIAGAAGVRLLAVRPECRGMGIGSALTHFCIERARDLGKSTIILHTTRAMDVAWGMYEKIGFERFPQIDFMQGNLEVFGFRLHLTANRVA